MINANRRAMLALTARATVFGGLAGLLEACGTNPNVQTVANDVSLVADGLSGAVGELANVQGLNIPATDMGQVSSALAALKDAAGQISSASTTVAQQPIVQQVAKYAGIVVSVLGPLLASSVIPGVGPIVAALGAAQVLIPVIASVVQIALPASAAPALLPLPADPNTARVILRGMALKAAASRK